MIKLTYGHVSGNNFVQAVQKLARAQLPAKTAYTLKRIIDKLESKKKDIGKEWTEMVSAHVQMEGGRPALDAATGEFKYLGETDKKALEEKEEAFSKKEFVLDTPPVHYAMLAGVTFSPSEASLLDGIIQFEDVVGEGNVIPMTRKQAGQAPLPPPPSVI